MEFSPQIAPIFAQFENDRWYLVCAIGGMALLQFRPKPKAKVPPVTTSLQVGAYAGWARFQPNDRAVLPLALERAVGQVIEVGYAGIAPNGEPFAGQAMYLEWRRDEVLDGFLVPEQDLEFLHARPGGVVSAQPQIGA